LFFTGDIDSTHTHIPYKFSSIFGNDCIRGGKLKMLSLLDLFKKEEYEVITSNNRNLECEMNITLINDIQWFLENEYYYNFYFNYVPASLDHSTFENNGNTLVRIGEISKNYSIEYDEERGGRFNVTEIKYKIFNKLKIKVIYANNSDTVTDVHIKTDSDCEFGEDAKEEDINNKCRFEFVFDTPDKTGKINDKISWNESIIWSIVNAFLTTVILAVAVGYIFIRTVRKDIENYNIRVGEDDFLDDSSWKQVSNDVFRKPKYILLFSAFFGTGIQVIK
jgi:hypothetical protein